jgi:hypothetical protein
MFSRKARRLPWRRSIALAVILTAFSGAVAVAADTWIFVAGTSGNDTINESAMAVTRSTAVVATTSSSAVVALNDVRWRGLQLHRVRSLHKHRLWRPDGDAINATEGSGTINPGKGTNYIDVRSSGVYTVNCIGKNDTVYANTYDHINHCAHVTYSGHNRDALAAIKKPGTRKTHHHAKKHHAREH